MELNKLVGSAIKSLRLEAGMSRKEFAQKSGISQSHIAKIEKGVVVIRFLTLWAMCESLNIKPSEFVSKYLM